MTLTFVFALFTSSFMTIKAWEELYMKKALLILMVIGDALLMFLGFLCIFLSQLICQL